MTKRQEYQKRYQEKYKNDPKRAAYRKQYSATHKEQVKKHSQKFYKNNRQELLIKLKEKYLKDKIEIYRLLGNKCKGCGVDDFRVLQIDHIEGGGRNEKKKLTSVRYQSFVLLSILNKEKRYQLLCANCNWIKRYENDEGKYKTLAFLK